MLLNPFSLIHNPSMRRTSSLASNLSGSLTRPTSAFLAPHTSNQHPPSLFYSK